MIIMIIIIIIMYVCRYVSAFVSSHLAVNVFATPLAVKVVHLFVHNDWCQPCLQSAYRAWLMMDGDVFWHCLWMAYGCLGWSWCWD